MTNQPTVPPQKERTVKDPHEQIVVSQTKQTIKDAQGQK